MVNALRPTITLLLALCGAMIFASSLHAEPRLSLEVEPLKGALDDLFTMRVILEEAPDDAVPLLEGGEDFHLTLIGPEHSIIIVNGEVQQQRALRYSLKPRKKGVLLSPSASLELPHRTLRAASVKVEVTDAPAQAPDEDDGSVFMEQGLSTRTAYVGQQLLLDVNIYSAVPLFEMDIPEVAPDGMVQRRLENDERTTRMRRGSRYSVFTTRRLLYPLRSGTLQLPPRSLKGKVRALRSKRASPFGGSLFGNDFFDSFFGTIELTPIERKSNALSIEVRPLPAPPVDAPGWNPNLPLVGSTTLSIDERSRSLATGEPLTLHSRLVSEGNLSALDELPWKLPAHIKRYESDVETTVRLHGQRALQQRTSTVTLVPLKPGDFSLPPIELLYFDEVKQQYAVARSDPLALSVTGPSLVTSEPSPLEQKDQPAQESSDPLSRYSEPSIIDEIRERTSMSLALFAALCVAGALLLITLYRRSQDQWQRMRVAWRNFDRAESAQELSLACDELLRLKSGSTLSPLLFDALQSPTRTLSEEQKFRLEGLRSDLAALHYGAPAGEISEIRERARSLIRSL